MKNFNMDGQDIQDFKPYPVHPVYPCYLILICHFSGYFRGGYQE